MKYKFHSLLLIVLLALLLIHCFGSVDKRGSVSGYNDGIIKTVGGNFHIGKLPENWRQKEINFRAVLFQNERTQSTITVSSWCKRAFDDGSLQTLTEQLYSGLENLKIIESHDESLDGRESRVTAARGKLDSQPVYLKTYVLKMNECVFDFLYVATPDKLSDAADFDVMVEGFSYGQGPRIL